MYSSKLRATDVGRTVVGTLIWWEKLKGCFYWDGIMLFAGRNLYVMAHFVKILRAGKKWKGDKRSRFLKLKSGNLLKRGNLLYLHLLNFCWGVSCSSDFSNQDLPFHEKTFIQSESTLCFSVCSVLQVFGRFTTSWWREHRDIYWDFKEVYWPWSIYRCSEEETNVVER